jgi:hypothetical protein
MSRRLTRSIARLLAFVLLASQIAIAAYACPALAGTPHVAAGTLAVTADEGADEGAAESASAPMPGCSGMAAALDPASANLCAEHCKLGQQSHDVPQVAVPLPVLTALYTLSLSPVRAPALRPAAARLDALVAASPPLAVLHCVYRI